MVWRKLGYLAADLVRVNGRYFADSGQRNRMREALRRDGMTAGERELLAAELRASTGDARAKAQLAPTSTALTGIRPTTALPPHLNLLIGDVREGSVFAGVRTALTVAKDLAGVLGLPLRILQLDLSSIAADTRNTQRYVRELLALPDLEVLSRESILAARFAADDIWLATHWKTAHAAQVAADSGTLTPERVIYLIQDYEPGFSPWSTDSVLAAQTYHAGFVPLVNSTPLWTYLTTQENLEIPRELVFAPRFEEDLLRRAAASRDPDGPIRVLYYARPSKPRNLFRLGVAALRMAVRELGTDASLLEFVSAGEHHAPIELGNGVTLTSLGRLPWAAYFELLSRTSVALSLQASPHPSHPPFDAAISGAISITNDFAGTRGGLHPRIVVAAAETSALAQALVTSIRAANVVQDRSFLAVADGVLGQPLAAVLPIVAQRLIPR